MNCPSRFWGVFRAGEPTAYLIVHTPRADGRLSLLAEFAGERLDIAGALPGVVDRMGLANVGVRVSVQDAAAFRAFAARGIVPRVECAPGTFLPLRMVDAMERLRPRVAERAGARTAQTLRFRESGQGAGSIEGKDATLGIMMTGGEEARVLGRAQVAKLLFGAPDDDAPESEGSETVMEIIARALPLPTPWYGLNYV